MVLREIAHMPSHEIALLRTQPAWAIRVANAHTLLRKLHALAAYMFEPERFEHLLVPTLLLVGSDNPPAELRDAEAVAAALPDSRILILPGQQHIAMYTAPELFVREVVNFLVE
jgi:pimeloyl-ACP methyl ester carboxylesterase